MVAIIRIASRAQTIGLAMDNALQWKDLINDAIKLALVVLILDRHAGSVLSTTSSGGSRAPHRHQLSVQSALFHGSGKAMTWWQSLRHFMEATAARIELVE